MAGEEATAYQVYIDLQNQLVIYQLVCLLIGAMLIVVLVIFLPFIPWAISKVFTKKPVIALMDKTRNMRFRGGFILRNGMFFYKKQPMYFVKKYPGIFYFAGVPFDICNIDLGFVQHPTYNNFIHELRQMGYKDWRAIDTALEFNTINPEDTDTLTELGFATYEEAKAALNPAGLTRKSEILAPYFSSCCLDELIGYGADVPPASIAGEVDDGMLSQKTPELQTLAQYFPYVIILAIVIIVGALGYKIVTG